MPEPDFTRRFNSNGDLLCNDCRKPYEGRQSCLIDDRFNRWSADFYGDDTTGHAYCDDCTTPVGGYHHQQCTNKFCVAHGINALETLMGTRLIDGPNCDCIAGRDSRAN